MRKSIEEDAAKSFNEMAQKADERAELAHLRGDTKLERCCRAVARAHRENAKLVRSKNIQDSEWMVG